jgi:quercetin dioxygenase-like cupin family protein
MNWNDYIKEYKPLAQPGDGKHGKATLFENDALLVGLNIFEDGQEMRKHAHKEQNRVYLVLEGEGVLGVDVEEQGIHVGQVLFVPAGHAHWLRQTGEERLVVMVGIAPAHAD